MKTYDRHHPFLSRLQERSLLTKSGSTKKTCHLSLTLAGSSLTYQPGDTIAILPSNEPVLVHHFLDSAQLQGNDSMKDYLTHKANLFKATSHLLKTLHERSPHPQTRELLLTENKPKCLQFLESSSPADLFLLHPDAGLSPEEISKLLLPLLPRFYSIASSQLVFPDEVHLTVTDANYLINGKWRRGLGPDFLCERTVVGETPIPIYLQPAHGFTLPSDPDASIILIGPGTGIAPFRAFLQERLAKEAKGKNWLFFGERNRATDFYYEDFWLELEKQGRLRLDLAFSRDGAEKVYVQHCLWEKRKDIWAWMEEGAYFYVCGDANEMAKDVEATMQRIAKEEGSLTEEQARLKIKALRANKRYLMDVY
jgi:sulfite reductase (NADPH) flavoprotein alpha-component